MNTYLGKTAVHIAHFTTPAGVQLNGLWVGALRPKRVIIWTHGLGSNMFSKLAIAQLLAKNRTAVLMYNNRGAFGVMSVRTKKGTHIRAGSAHELLADSVDDIEGAIRYAKQSGAKDIFLAGHSTGSQKTALWAAKKGRGVKGVMLLAPMSDYAGALAQTGKKKLETVARYAATQIRKRQGHELIPYSIWPYGPVDAQRFISLYTKDGADEIFSYAQATKDPKVFRAGKVPTLVVLAERDEYADRPAADIELWFLEHMYTGEVVIIPNADHGFKGEERAVVKAIDGFMKERYN